MGKTTVTVKATAIDALTATQRRGLDAALKAVLALEPSDNAIVRAVRGVMTLKGFGLSGRGVAAMLAAHSDGRTSTATVARLILAGDASTGDDLPDMGDAGDAIVATLYRIACKGKAEDVTRAGALIRKAKDGDDAYTAVHAVYTEVMAATKRAALTPPQRNVAGEAANGGKVATKVAADAKPATPAQPVQSGIAAASLSALLAEVERRLNAKAATVTTEDVDSADRIAARVGELVMAGRLATVAAGKRGK